MRLIAGLVFASVSVSAQVPQPFPRPNTPSTQKPAEPPAAPAAPAVPVAPQSRAGVPTEAMLGAPVYPSAVFLTSYDAGLGQRFYLFGATVPYLDMVNYYKTVLKQKGDELFESPPTHQFETGRYRDESMAFMPSVTVKDFTFGGSGGYPNPKRGATPERFPTIIQIVPAPR